MAECARKPRRYQKQNNNYWDFGIKESRTKRARISAEVVDDAQEKSQIDIESLTATEIKKQLREMGIKTRFRCLEKLKKLLLDSITEKENLSPNLME